MQVPAKNLLQNIIIDEFKILQERSSNTGSLDYFKNNPNALTTNNVPVSDTFSDMAAYNKKMALSKYEPKGNWYDTPEGIANHILRASAKYRSSVKTFGAVTEFDDYEADVVDAFSRISNRTTMSKINDIIKKKSGKNFIDFLNGFMSGPEFVDKMGGMSIVDSIQRIYGAAAYTEVIQYLKKPNNFDFKDYIKMTPEILKFHARYSGSPLSPGNVLIAADKATEWYKTHNTWDKFINAEDGLRDMVYSPAGIVISTATSIIPQTKLPTSAIFGLLACDDIYRITKDRDMPMVFGELIIDMIGVFAGGSGKIIAGTTAKIMAPIIELAYKLASKLTPKIILQMMRMLKSVSTEILVAVKLMLEGMVKVFAKIIQSMQTLITQLKNLIKNVPVLKTFVQAIIDSIKRVKIEIAYEIKQIKQALEYILTAIKWLFNKLNVGRDIRYALEEFGIIKVRDVTGKVIQNTANVALSIAVLNELVPTDIEEYIKNQGALDDVEAIENPITRKQLQKDTNFKDSYYFLNTNSPTIGIIPNKEKRGDTDPLEQIQTFDPSGINNNNIKSIAWDLVSVLDSVSATDPVYYEIKLSFPESHLDSLAESDKRLFNEYSFVIDKAQLEKISVIKNEQKNMYNLNTIILEEVIRHQLFEQGDLDKLKKKKAELEAEKKEADKIGDSRKSTKLKQEILEIDKQIANAAKDARTVTPNPKPDKSDDSSGNTSTRKTRPVPEPKNYKGKNGRLTASDLQYTKKSSSSKLQLAPAAADSYDRMIKAMQNDGVAAPKKVAGYRTYAEQYNIIDWNHYASSGTYRTKRKDPAAQPGKSLHGLGLAIDVDYPGTSAAADWIKANGVPYGWVWYTRDGGEGESIEEPWHFNYVADKDVKKDSSNPTQLSWYIETFNPLTIEGLKNDAILVGAFLILRYRRSIIKNLGLAATGNLSGIIKNFKRATSTSPAAQTEKLVLQMSKSPNKFQYAFADIRRQLEAGRQLAMPPNTPSSKTIGGNVKIQFYKLADEAYKKKIINKEELEELRLWIQRNEPVLVSNYTKEAAAAAKELWLTNRLSLEEFTNWLPKSMSNDARFMEVMKGTSGKEYIKNVVPADVTPKYAEVLKKLDEDGLLRDTRRLQTSMRLGLTPTVAAKSTTTTAIRDIEKVFINLKPPRGIKPIPTITKSEPYKGTIKQVNIKDAYTKNIIQTLKTEYILPDKWFKGKFPKTIEAWKKDWKQFKGQLPSDTMGADYLDKRLWEKHYWKVQSKTGGI